MKNNFRDIIIRFLPFIKADYSPRVICFHEINDKDKFKKRISWLSEQYKIVSLSSLLQNKEHKTIAITFDDGYSSWMDNVIPVLNDLNTPATFFITSGFLDLEGEKLKTFLSHNLKRPNENLAPLSKHNLLSISKNPLFEIGGHTVNHYQFDKNTPIETATHQIKNDKEYLENLIGKSIHSFAYPFGQYNNAPEQVIEVLKKVGYTHSFTIVPGSIAKEKNNYLLPRDSLELYQSIKVWKKWLQGGYDYLVRIKINIYKSLSISRR